MKMPVKGAPAISESDKGARVKSASDESAPLQVHQFKAPPGRGAPIKVHPFEVHPFEVHPLRVHQIKVHP